MNKRAAAFRAPWIAGLMEAPTSGSPRRRNGRVVIHRAWQRLPRRVIGAAPQPSFVISSRGASPEWNYLLKDKKRFDVVSGSASEITIAVPYCGSVVGSLMGVEVDSAGVLPESVPDTTESVPDMLSGSHKGVILEAPGWSSVFYSLMWQGVSQQLSQHHGSEISVATSQSVLTIQSKSNCERCCCEKCKLCAGHFI